jgi:beta-lactamase superfamily II metal-dependent hydrolase
MCLKNLKPTLTVLDVGHGNAAVLRDHDNILVVDTGSGPHVLRYLRQFGANVINALLLSHADYDHIGGAITLLLDEDININQVHLNPDSSKETAVFKQLRYALCEAEIKHKTDVIPSLTSGTKITGFEAKIEVLFPSATEALSGIGGSNLSGIRQTSNSLSAAIKISNGNKASVLLGGDIEFGCLKDWDKRGVIPSSNILVFPHHGGLTGGNKDDAEIFAYSLSKMVMPEIVIFSVHRTQYDLPRKEILDALLNSSNCIKFICTQLPDRFHDEVNRNPAWMSHWEEDEKRVQEGSIEITLAVEGYNLTFYKQEF